MTYDHIVWLDLETTGLDPVTDVILEVALVLTTPQGEELDARSWVIAASLTARAFMSRYVLDMHDKSGLWAAARSPDATPIHRADREASAWLTAHGVTSRNSRLGGRNVGNFDLQFLRHSELSYTASRLPFRCLDITSVHAALEAAGVNVELGGRDGDHRALADLRRDIALYRTWLKTLRGET